ncbi:MAG: hypothetical protein R3C26_18740 [Calditrichia bacterium]
MDPTLPVEIKNSIFTNQLWRCAGTSLNLAITICSAIPSTFSGETNGSSSVGAGMLNGPLYLDPAITITHLTTTPRSSEGR